MEDNKIDITNFLIESSEVDGIEIQKLKGNKKVNIEADDYDFLEVRLDNSVKRIKKSVLDSYASSHNLESEDFDVNVDPFSNLGTRRIIEHNADEEISNGEDLTSFLEDILKKLFSEYNYLVLPKNRNSIPPILDENYIESQTIKNYVEINDLSSISNTENNVVYSMALKIELHKVYELFAEGKANQLEEYIPFKVFFYLNEENSINKIKIDEENTRQANLTHQRYNILEEITFNKTLKDEINKDIKSTQFEKELVALNGQLDEIISEITIRIKDALKNDEVWIKDTYLYDRIASFKKEEISEVNAKIIFRYLTRTPLPYSVKTIEVTKNYANKVTSQRIELKQGPSDKDGNLVSYSTCPKCGSRPILKDKGNLFRLSNEYVRDFIGCQKCLNVQCDECAGTNANYWSKSIQPDEINPINTLAAKRYYRAGKCDFLSCKSHDDGKCMGKNLCSLHATYCSHEACNDKIYCKAGRTVIRECANPDCYHQYCSSHFSELSECEECGKEYCPTCSEFKMHSCQFCGNKICSDCAIPTIKLDNDVEELGDSFVCKNCMSLLQSEILIETSPIEGISKKEKVIDINIRNRCLLKASSLGTNFEYLCMDIGDENQPQLLDFGNYKSEDYLLKIYKEDAKLYWENGDQKNKYYYRKPKNTENSDVIECSGEKCYGVFYHQVKKHEIKGKTYYFCSKCLKTCELCNQSKLLAFKMKNVENDKIVRELFAFEDKNKTHYYCSNCCAHNLDSSSKVSFTDKIEDIEANLLSNDIQWMFSGIDKNGNALKKDYDFYYNKVFSDNADEETKDEIKELSALLYPIVGTSSLGDKKYVLTKKDLFICPDTRIIASHKQGATCDYCGETYSSLMFSKNALDSDVKDHQKKMKCDLCRSLENVSQDNTIKSLLDKSFYIGAKKNRKNFKSFCTANTLLIDVNGMREVYHYNDKKHKYVKKNISK